MAAAKPMAPTMFGVPASNRAGGSAQVGACEGDGFNHVTPSLPGGHPMKNLPTATEDADSRRSVEFMSAEHVEVATEFGDVDGQMGHSLSTVDENRSSPLFCLWNHDVERGDHPQCIADMAERHQSSSFA